MSPSLQFQSPASPLSICTISSSIFTIPILPLLLFLTDTILPYTPVQIPFVPYHCEQFQFPQIPTKQQPPHSSPGPYNLVDGEEPIHLQVDNSSDYKLCFHVGNVSGCNCCYIKFSDHSVIVIQHAEYHDYTNPHTSLPASKYGNAYYHLRKSCIQLKKQQIHQESVINSPC